MIKNAFGNSDICGVLQFVGENKMLNWKLQVTVDRMPIQINSLEQISEQEDRRIFKNRNNEQ